MAQSKNIAGDELSLPELSQSKRSRWNTPRSQGKPRMSLAGSVTLALIVMAVLTALLLALMLAFAWNTQFRSYSRENMERLARSTAQSIAESYEEHNSWTPEVLAQAVSASAASPDIVVQVLNEHGQVIYDDSWASAAAAKAETETALPDSATSFSSADDTASEASTKSEEQAPHETSHASISTSDFERPETPLPSRVDAIVSAPIVVGEDRQVGTLRLFSLTSDMPITKADAAFRQNSYNAIVIAAALAALLATFIGWLLSRRLTWPILRISSTARAIRAGDLTARTGLRGDDEVGQLGETFDDMASSLEKDINLEHRLTSDVAHELRTPLMAIQANVEAMQDGILPCDDEQLAVVDSEVRRLSRLVDAMLALSRMENGSTPFKPRRTELVGLIQSLARAHEQLFSDSGLKLRVALDIPRPECYADVDRDLLRQAITNILSNSLRYTPEGGWVVIKLSQERSRVLIAVSDTGIGIAEEDLPRVFSRFWRSDASRERVSGGLGVGLSLTKEIVERHHGYIRVESTLGKGTTFVINIPREQREARNRREGIERGGRNKRERPVARTIQETDEADVRRMPNWLSRTSEDKQQ